jgi:hypothetical protein
VDQALPGPGSLINDYKRAARCPGQSRRPSSGTPQDPAVAPAWVLPGQLEDQGLDASAGRRPAGLGAHGPGGMAAAGDVAVPAQDRVRVTSSHSPRRRVSGITLSRVASRARSAQFSFGRCGCRRCRTASWWRRIKISAVFHVSLRRDSRSHPVSCVIKRNTNRRHMTVDHYDRMPGRATLLVRAMDGILGTHSL